MKYLARFTLIFLFLPTLSLAAGVYDDFDSLGNNKDIAKRARRLDPKNKVRIVQNRLVDRNYRLELGVNYGTVAGGDSYLNTSNLGGSVDFHFNPRWSVGVRYYRSYNELTNQGKQVFDEAKRQQQETGLSGDVVDVDFPVNTTFATINFYPIYGKLNFFDLGISQFDVYTLLGYGQVQTNNTSSPAYTLGAGVGLWLNNHFSTRFEARYQSYEDKVYSGTRDLNLTIFSFSIGLIL